jgi:hypothetical protein
VPTQRSANAFAFGARNGVRMISMRSLLNTSSKVRLNLLSRSWIRNRIGVGRSGSDQASWRACWVVQRPSGFALHPARCTPPRLEFDEEEHIQAPEPERLDGEEVARDDRRGIGTEELAPTEQGASAGRRHVGLPEDLCDCCRRDSFTDACELSDDPLVAPTRVLPGKTKHQCTNLLGDRGPTRSPSAIRPPFPHKLAMPAKQRVRTNEERLPASHAQQLAGCSGRPDLSRLAADERPAAKNGEFVA